MNIDRSVGSISNVNIQKEQVEHCLGEEPLKSVFSFEHLFLACKELAEDWACVRKRATFATPLHLHTSQC